MAVTVDSDNPNSYFLFNALGIYFQLLNILSAFSFFLQPVYQIAAVIHILLELDCKISLNSNAKIYTTRDVEHTTKIT